MQKFLSALGLLLALVTGPSTWGQNSHSLRFSCAPELLAHKDRLILTPLLAQNMLKALTEHELYIIPDWLMERPEAFRKVSREEFADRVMRGQPKAQIERIYLSQATRRSAPRPIPANFLPKVVSPPVVTRPNPAARDLKPAPAIFLPADPAPVIAQTRSRRKKPEKLVTNFNPDHFLTFGLRFTCSS